MPDMMSIGTDGNVDATTEKLDMLYKNRAYLLNHQYDALQRWKKPDWENLKPVLVCCDANESLTGIWNYYRYLISSQAQGGFPSGRSSFWLVIDEETQAFLGAFGYTSYAQQWPFLEEWLGWRNFAEQRLEHRKHIQFLARCLPSETFGDLLGGKLMASMALSQEILETLELRYSLPVAMGAIATLHGQGSQYNRLDKEGIIYIGDDSKGRGTYICETRYDGIAFCKGDANEVGNWKVPTLQERIDYWRDRWYTKRLQHKGIPLFESRQYALSRYIRNDRPIKSKVSR